MKSARPKVLHELCGRPMLWHVLRALHDAGVPDVVVVTSGEVAPHLAPLAADAGHEVIGSVVQEPQLGSGHAVRAALAEMPAFDGTILVVNGDMPLVQPDLIRTVLDRSMDSLNLATARMPLPSAYGRVLREGPFVVSVVEAADASDDDLLIDEMNAGLYAYDELKLRDAIEQLTADNAQQEYYLTDTIAYFVKRGERVRAVLAQDFRTVLGVNDRVELAAAREHLNRRLCEHHMRQGVSIVDPATTYLEPDLTLSADATILPNTAIGRRSSVGPESEIGPNSRLQNAQIGRHVIVSESVVVDSTIGDFSYVGPWAHVRAGSTIGTGARIGNFVEVKASKLAAGVRAGHLTYLGDATVGERSNIGAGTITCNFDGAEKHPTAIGKDAFIGSNSSLIAPVTIGDGAATGAGAIVTRDVGAGERVAGNPARPMPKKG
jgi:bifunctional UDP-N-acetylglucosamine pyrophosphorylase/glucosamine-1-phosphate N-acetyltransferase